MRPDLPARDLSLLGRQRSARARSSRGPARCEHGGTFAVFLACDALRKGYRATIYTYNLTVFDPTWFSRRRRHRRPAAAPARGEDGRPAAAGHDGGLSRISAARRTAALRRICRRADLIRGLLRRGCPILTGLSATYLYPHCAGVRARTTSPDDIRGHPSGHFVVIAGYDRLRRHVLVVDPYQPNPYGAVARVLDQHRPRRAPRSCSASSRTTPICSSSIRPRYAPHE